MDTHNNARLTPTGREHMVRAVVESGLSKAEAASAPPPSRASAGPAAWAGSTPSSPRNLARPRYQRDAPGELIHIDNKKLGKFRLPSFAAAAPAAAAVWCRPSVASCF
jgi:hypothetical protein